MLKVLLVDDRTSVCEGLKKLIPWREVNAEIVGIARNGEEALNVAEMHHPDLIITDIRMPIMDGLTLCKEIYDRMPDTVIIILSAYDDFSYAQNALRFGVTDYILKPIDRAKLNQITEKLSEISLRINGQHSLNNLLYNSNVSNELDSILKQGISQEIMLFIDRMFNTLDMRSSRLTRELCMKLAALLFKSIEESGFIPEIFSISREKSMEKLHLLKTNVQMREYIETMYLTAAQAMQDKKNSHRAATVELLRNYIEQHYMDPDLSVASIACSVGLSPNYTSLIFREVTGGNMTDYVTHLRIKQARELLRDPAMNVNDVAKRVGYHDAHYFTRVFKTMAGMTPSQYRSLVKSTTW